ncbi:helix-turn-helix transcriptional regulator [Gordonia sp. L191]|uniref:helix-turn-helix transcriptional regulator n=1 Tax=Gordonia sp. L191 TaxID=2982699 RepID=UPI0024BFBBA1|nr:helix-turn-helix transcriptional regulator [Gordonia sp. L191]WHU45169.1 helix-turn-helix transcriptional regulator [Gordonia sp. L191]
MKLRSPQLLQAFIGPEPDKKMSARQLARSVEVHPSFINHLTSGRSASCTPKVADRIAGALGVPTEVLFEARVSTTEQHNSKPNAAA